ncbi:hypothetical protein M3Y97_01098300 [Aphelenchoides bicaudatus]|nr:hypothetical protein M3Y97_01098300 [Aphelenchoides bicaudatus]
MFWDDFIAFVWRPWEPFHLGVGSSWILGSALVGFCLSWCTYKKSTLVSQSPDQHLLVVYVRIGTYAFFYIGLFMTGSGLALSTSITFLMFERVLIISKSGFHARHQNYIVRVTLLCTTSVLLFVILNATIREVPLAPMTACQSFFCVMKNGSAVINSTLKTAIGATNVVICVFFISILFFYTRKGASAKNGRFKTANMLVLYAIGSEVLFIIIPRIFELSCNFGTWVLCPYNQTVMGTAVEVNVLLTGIVYMFVLKPKPKKQNSIATVTVLSVNNNRTEAFK